MQKKYLYSLYCIVLLYCLPPSGSLAQTPANNINTVEYKWGDGQLSQIMPFDEGFVLKLTGMPKSSLFDSLQVTLYEIRKNYPLFNRKSKNDLTPNVITYDQFKSLPVIKKYELRISDRPADNTDTFAFIPQPYHLEPNSQYIIEVKAVSQNAPGEDQKDSIKSALENSDAIRAIFTQLGKKYGQPGKPFSDIKIIQKQLDDAIRQELTKLNKNYVFKSPPDEGKQLHRITDFVTTIKGLNQTAKELSKAIKDSPPKGKDSAALAANITNQSDIINGIDYGDFAFDEDKRAPLTKAAAGIDPAGMPESVKPKLLRIKPYSDSLAQQADDLLSNVIPSIVLDNVVVLTPMGSNYPAAMSDQANNYLALDFGLAYVGNFSRFQSYYGLNIYLRPINKNIPLSRYYTLKDWFSSRTSFLLGVTFASIEKDNVRKGILGDKGLIAGVGLRILSFLRISGGGLLYYRYPSNPLINKDNYSTKISPFTSVSIDFDVQQLLGVFGSSLFPPKATTTP